MFYEVENILKGSLVSIPSPSPLVKIQIMGSKACLRCEGKTLLDITQQCSALLPQVNFPANNLNFHRRRRWWDQIQAIFLNLFYFKKWKAISEIICTNSVQKRQRQRILFWVCRQIDSRQKKRKKEWPLHFVHFLGEFELLISSGSEKNATWDRAHCTQGCTGLH